MGRESGFSDWKALFKWVLVLGCIIGGFALYRANRETISRWMNKPLAEMVPEAEPAPPPSPSGKEDAFRQAQKQRFEEGRIQAEVSREERQKVREERKAREEEEESAILQAVDASLAYLDKRAVLKAQGFDPWSDPDTCRCYHEDHWVVSRSESQAKVRARYKCMMEPKQDAPRSQTSKEWVIEIDAGYAKDASGAWEYAGPRP